MTGELTQQCARHENWLMPGGTLRSPFDVVDGVLRSVFLDRAEIFGDRGLVQAHRSIGPGTSSPRPAALHNSYSRA
jgi:hypothetical protein